MPKKVTFSETNEFFEKVTFSETNEFFETEGEIVIPIKNPDKLKEIEKNIEDNKKLRKQKAEQKKKLREQKTEEHEEHEEYTGKKWIALNEKSVVVFDVTFLKDGICGAPSPTLELNIKLPEHCIEVKIEFERIFHHYIDFSMQLQHTSRAAVYKNCKFLYPLVNRYKTKEFFALLNKIHSEKYASKINKKWFSPKPDRTHTAWIAIENYSDYGGTPITTLHLYIDLLKHCLRKYNNKHAPTSKNYDAHKNKFEEVFKEYIDFKVKNLCSSDMETEGEYFYPLVSNYNQEKLFALLDKTFKVEYQQALEFYSCMKSELDNYYEETAKFIISLTDLKHTKEHSERQSLEKKIDEGNELIKFINAIIDAISNTPDNKKNHNDISICEGALVKEIRKLKENFIEVNDNINKLKTSLSTTQKFYVYLNMVLVNLFIKTDPKQSQKKAILTSYNNIQKVSDSDGYAKKEVSNNNRNLAKNLGYVGKLYSPPML